ncbi:MAG: recombination protein RecR [Polyangiaceae bacterium]|nr:recombination protein RecR [Polyangiaceae bacterium]
MFPDRLLRVVQLLSRLPGVGEKTAQRYALALLVGDENVPRDLGRALSELRDHVGPCSICGHVADRSSPDEAPRCSICRDSRRDPSILCVVARVQDLLSIERSGAMRGRYHVLGKLLSPLDGVGRDDIGVDRLIARVSSSDGAIREVLVATPPSVDGEATALLLSRELGALGVHVSRIASGVPHGGDLEFADQVTIGRAIEHRRRFG